jgi:thioredoxin-like negative regulator of GroEL
MRSERDGEAQEVLRGVIATGSSDWVVVVAYQELGRHYLETGRYDEARILLAAAVERFPANQRLRIQLACALDRVGKRRESRSMSTNLPPDDGSSSPRLLYRVPEHRDTLRSRRELVRHVNARIPMLASALTEARSTG